MDVFEQIKLDPQSIVGMMVEYDYGGTEKLKFKVKTARKMAWYWSDEDGVKHESDSVSISQDGDNFYVVSATNIKIIN